MIVSPNIALTVLDGRESRYILVLRVVAHRGREEGDWPDCDIALEKSRGQTTR